MTGEAVGKKARIVWFDEAARRFGVTARTLREWVVAGRFPAPRGDGGRLFYTEAELDAIIEHGLVGRWKPQEYPFGGAEKGGERRKKTEKDGDPGRSAEIDR